MEMPGTSGYLGCHTSRWPIFSVGGICLYSRQGPQASLGQNLGDFPFYPEVRSGWGESKGVSNAMKVLFERGPPVPARSGLTNSSQLGSMSPGHAKWGYAGSCVGVGFTALSR